MANFKWLHEQYKYTNPITNPICYQYHENFKKPVLGKNGKLYHKRGRMNDSVFENYNDVCYAVPGVWERPFGFKYNGYSCWTTKSEILAMRHYREFGNAQNKLKKRFDSIIEKQDKLYALSKAIDSNIELPKLKDGFVPRPHQKVGIEYLAWVDKNILIADGMRTGKTATALMITASRKFDTCLIVCPAMLQTVWRDAINDTIYNPTINILESDDEIKFGYNIVSYDKIHTIDANVDICIGDEIHFILEPNARRSAGMNEIKAKLKIALSGTPILNEPSEILSVLRWLDEEMFKEIKLFLEHLNEDNYKVAKELAKELRMRCMLKRDASQLSPESAVFTNFIEIECRLPDDASLQQIGQSKIPYAVNYVNTY